MTLYSIALFIHVVGAVLVFVLLTTEVIGIGAGNGAAQAGRILGPITSLAILVPGLYLAAQTGWHAWVVVGLVGFLVLAVLGAYTGISFMRGQISRGAAVLSWAIRAGLALGILFDMTVKPDAAVAIAAAIIGTLAVAGGSIPLRSRLTTT